VEASASYQLGTRSAVELDKAVADFWRELSHSEELRAEVADAGLGPADLEQLRGQQAFAFREEGAGLDPTSVSLIVAFAPIVNHIAESLWDEVVLPWIRRRWGNDAVGPKK
jgi:hypothetical protein